MTTPTCYYKLLGLERTATDEDIRKAYRKLALKWHPDKNPENQEEAERRFKEICAAYEILSDKSKRSVYDRCGQDGLNGKHVPPSRPSSRTEHVRRRYTMGDNMFHGNLFGDDAFFSPFNDFGFTFRDPEVVYREFLSKHFSMINAFNDHARLMHAHFRTNSPKSVSVERMTRHRHVRTPNSEIRVHVPGQRVHNITCTVSPTMMGKTQVASTHITFSSSNRTGGPGQVHRTFRSTSSRFENGKSVTTRKIIQDNVETVEVEENGVLKMRTVNGKPVDIISERDKIPISTPSLQK